MIGCGPRGSQAERDAGEASTHALLLAWLINGIGIVVLSLCLDAEKREK
jgi:hypothetical protein